MQGVPDNNRKTWLGIPFTNTVYQGTGRACFGMLWQAWGQGLHQVALGAHCEESWLGKGWGLQQHPLWLQPGQILAPQLQSSPRQGHWECLLLFPQDFHHACWMLPQGCGSRSVTTVIQNKGMALQPVQCLFAMFKELWFRHQWFGIVCANFPRVQIYILIIPITPYLSLCCWLNQTFIDKWSNQTFKQKIATND